MSWNNHPHAASFPKRSGLFRRGPNLPPTAERNRKSIAALVAPAVPCERAWSREARAGRQAEGAWKMRRPNRHLVTMAAGCQEATLWDTHLFGDHVLR